MLLPLWYLCDCFSFCPMREPEAIVNTLCLDVKVARRRQPKFWGHPPREAIADPLCVMVPCGPYPAQRSRCHAPGPPPPSAGFGPGMCLARGPLRVPLEASAFFRTSPCQVAALALCPRMPHTVCMSYLQQGTLAVSDFYREPRRPAAYVTSLLALAGSLSCPCLT